MVLQSIIEPILLGLKSNQDTRRRSMAGDHDFRGLGQAQIARQVILDFS